MKNYFFLCADFFFIIYDLLRSQFYLSIFKLLILIYSGDKKKLINKTKNDTNLKANTKLSFFALKKIKSFFYLFCAHFMLVMVLEQISLN